MKMIFFALLLSGCQTCLGEPDAYYDQVGLNQMESCGKTCGRAGVKQVTAKICACKPGDPAPPPVDMATHLGVGR